VPALAALAALPGSLPLLATLAYLVFPKPSALPQPFCFGFRSLASFRPLLDKLEPCDVVIVTKLDRLGRNAIDVLTMVEHLKSMNVRAHCLTLGGDLSSPAGKMTIQVINAVAEFERDLLIERMNCGIKRAKA
jgi:DNA invertase Pin-like site-specific DNA recombinase